MTKTTLASIAIIASIALSAPAMAQEMTSGNYPDGTPRSTYDGGDHSKSGGGADERAEYCQRTHNPYICTYNSRGPAR